MYDFAMQTRKDKNNETFFGLIRHCPGNKPFCKNSVILSEFGYKIKRRGRRCPLLFGDYNKLDTEFLELLQNVVASPRLIGIWRFRLIKPAL